jgi:hypothetical protein
MLKNAYFRDRLEKYSELGGCLKLKMFKISFVENYKKNQPSSLGTFRDKTVPIIRSRRSKIDLFKILRRRVRNGEGV